MQEKQDKERDLQYLQRVKSILMQLDQLSNSSPLSSSSKSSSSLEQLQMNEPQLANPQHKQRQRQQLSNKSDNYNKLKNIESQFLFAVRKECIPGRDDSNGEINPTTHRQRECLRHVPTIGQTKTNNNDNNHKSEEVDMNLPKPRIGLMFPPGYIGQAFARWIADTLERSSTSSGISRSASSSSSNLGIHLDIISTTHVPVYGYGKSHGYTKIIRFVSLPLSLAVYDASLHGLTSSTSPTATLSSSSSSSSTGVADTSSLHDALERMKLGINKDGSSQTTTEMMGSILRLLLRWHCRLSRKYLYCVHITCSLFLSLSLYSFVT